jgi:hypothetical protein
VVDALERIHASLDDGGAVIDTQPVGVHPPVVGEDGPLGTLDMREWAKTIAAIDGEMIKTVEAGRFSVTAERYVVVVDVYDDLRELVEMAGEYAGTSVPPALARKVATTSGEVELHQDVRVRVLVKR